MCDNKCNVYLSQDSRFSQNGSMSQLIYAPVHELDYGTILCWAKNNLGEQEEPCTFHIIPAGIYRHKKKYGRNFREWPPITPRGLPKAWPRRCFCWFCDFFGRFLQVIHAWLTMLFLLLLLRFRVTRRWFFKSSQKTESFSYLGHLCTPSRKDAMRIFKNKK